jgi:DNA modification methylase
VTVLRGDARRLPLPDGCVDLIVTSPPYYGLRSYTDGGEHYAGQIGSEATPGEYVAGLVECTREWVRVLKPSGSLFVNLGDRYSTGNSGQSGLAELGKRWAGGGHSDGKAKRPSAAVPGMPPKSLLGLPWRYALAVTDQLGLILRAEIVWAKPNGLPESVTDRVRRAHEQVFHFTRQPRYYSAVDEIREPHAARTWEQHHIDVRAGLGMSISGHRQASVDGRRERSSTPEPNPLGKLPGSVWSIPTAPLVVPARLGVDHFAAFPPALVRPIVLGWSPPGVCQACGEGRRPIVHNPSPFGHVGPSVCDIEASGHVTYGATSQLKLSGGPRQRWKDAHPATITGYACACISSELPGLGGAPRWPASEVTMGVSPQAGQGAGQPSTGNDRDGSHPGRGLVLPPTRPALVVDPFGGTGTTALVAAVHGRHGITVDASADYCRLAAWRCHDPGERARALDVPRPPVVPDDQVALFDV